MATRCPFKPPCPAKGPAEFARETDPCCDPQHLECDSLGQGMANLGHATDEMPMNQIIYIVGLVVIVLFVLGYLGLR